MAVDIHVKFLRLFSWDGDELDKFLPQWLRAAEFLRLSEEDVADAMDVWIPRYWDLSLMGIRKLIAAFIREIVELSKAGDYKAAGHKLIYTNPTSSHACVYANRIAGEGRVHVFHPEFIITTFSQAFFGKMTNGVEENSCMSGNCRHCALNAARVDSSTSGQLVAPTVTWSWGLHCNENSKSVEMVNCIAGDDWQDVFITIPHDAPLGTIENQDDYRVQYLAEQIRDGQKEISRLTGVEVTEAHLRQSTEEYLCYMRRMDTLTDLVLNADPQPISGNALNQFGVNMQVCFDMGLGYIIDAIDTVIEEVRERIEKGIGVVPKGAPKLACHFQPLHLPWIENAFMENGVSIALGRIFPQGRWLDEAVDEKDMFLTAARHCLMCPNAVNMRNEAAIAIRMLRQYSFDGALFGFFSHDRWIGALHKTMVRRVEEVTGIPHYYLEGEFWGSDDTSRDDRLPIIRSICNSLKISKL